MLREYAEFECLRVPRSIRSCLAEFKDKFKEENLTKRRRRARRKSQGLALAAKWQERAVEIPSHYREWKNQTRSDQPSAAINCTQVWPERNRYATSSETRASRKCSTHWSGQSPFGDPPALECACAISDDVFVKTGKPTGAPERAAGVLFGGTMNKKEG